MAAIWVICSSWNLVSYLPGLSVTDESLQEDIFKRSPFNIRISCREIWSGGQLLKHPGHQDLPDGAFKQKISEIGWTRSTSSGKSKPADGEDYLTDAERQPWRGTNLPHFPYSLAHRT